MRKIKTLLLLHDLSPTGAPKVAVTAFEQLQDRVDLWTVSYQGGPLRERVAKLGRVQTLVSYSWPGMPAAPRAILLFLWHRLLSLGKARIWSLSLRRWKPDVVYINSIAGLLAAKRLNLPRAPVILHVHELDSFLRPMFEQLPDLFLRLPTRYIAVSEAVADALTTRYQVERARISVIHAFVDAHAQAITTPAAPTDGRFVVGGAGVTSWVKGVQLWLLMAAELRKTLGDAVRFVWVGVSDDEVGWQFREMARKLGLTACVECVPFTKEPQNYYAHFDVFAMTSWEESASLVTLETMLLEKPVVCFAGTGGPREFVGDAGVVLDEFDPRAMAETIAALLHSPERRARLGAAARRRVLENFTAETQAEKIWREICAVVGEGAPGG